MKTIAWVLLVVFFFSVVPFSAQADDTGKICFEPAVAARMLADFNYKNDLIKDLNLKLTNVTDQEATSEQEITTLKKESLGLKTDLQTTLKASQDYKDLYTKANTDLIAAQKDKPSRFTWWSIGAVSAVVVIIAGFFAVK